MMRHLSTRHPILNPIASVTVLLFGLMGIRCATPHMEMAPSTDERETVVIMGINDFHGALEPRRGKTSDGVEVESGGIETLSGYVQLLRSEFDQRLLVLDAGDEWQGSIESNGLEGAPVVQAFNRMGVQAAAVGNHEFDFGPATIKKRIGEALYPFLASNFLMKASHELPSWPNLKKSLIINTGRVKIGIVGLSTEQTPVTTAKKNVVDFDFADLAENARREAGLLRAQGAQIVIALAHAGLTCDRRGPNPTSQPKLEIRTRETLQTECRPQDEIVQMLKKLPQGTLDAVVSGHSHQITHHWVQGVPVIQAGSLGQYFNLLYLTYDIKHQRLIPDHTRIEGPVPVCAKFWENTQTCDARTSPGAAQRGPLVQARFHDEWVRKDSRMDDLMESVRERVSEVKAKVVAHAERPVTHVRTEESEMGNLLADAMRAELGTDFALINPGGIRTGFDSGTVSYGEVFQVFPFDNRASVLTVTGDELKNILRVAMSGARGYFGISGLTVKVIGIQYPAPSSDLNHDKTISHWEINRLLDVRDSGGKKIQGNKKYRLVTTDFLVNGGDDMGWPMSQVPHDRIQLDSGLLIRDVFEHYLIKQKVLNPPTQPLVDPTHPRIIIVKKKTR